MFWYRGCHLFSCESTFVHSSHFYFAYKSIVVHVYMLLSSTEWCEIFMFYFCPFLFWRENWDFMQNSISFLSELCWRSTETSRELRTKWAQVRSELGVKPTLDGTKRSNELSRTVHDFVNFLFENDSCMKI